MSGSQFRGLVYRALNPLYAQAPLSGAGASLHGGRFNKKGRPALYVALSIQTAILEINQIGSLQPTTLVSYQAGLHDIFDVTDPSHLETQSMSPDQLASQSWRDEMIETGLSQTQRFSEESIELGYRAMKVPSYARGARPQDINMVIWSWNDDVNQLTVIDDENRL